MSVCGLALYEWQQIWGFISSCDIRSTVLNVLRAVGWRDDKWLKIKECSWKGRISVLGLGS